MWSFAIRNWSWLLPCTLAAVFALCAGVERLEVLTLEKNAATEQAAAEKAVNDAKAADALKTARLEAEHAAAVKILQEKANAQQVAIAGAPRSDACLHTGAARAFLGGLPGADKARSGAPRSAAGVDRDLPR
jgi:hypothetical protein